MPAAAVASLLDWLRLVDDSLLQLSSPLLPGLRCQSHTVLGIRSWPQQLSESLVKAP